MHPAITLCGAPPNGFMDRPALDDLSSVDERLVIAQALTGLQVPGSQQRASDTAINVASLLSGSERPAADCSASGHRRQK
jgi:hypothetical protein